MLKIAVYGLSGSGKSTVINFIINALKKKGLTIQVIKFSEPLYLLQNKIYKMCGRNVKYYQQDQEMLETIAGIMRKVNLSSLTNLFAKKFNKCNSDVILNDDVRDYGTDYMYLKGNDFIFIRVKCDEGIRIGRLLGRNDISVVKNSVTTSDIDKFDAEFVIENNSNKEKLRNDTLSVLSIILKDKRYVKNDFNRQ